MNFNKNNFIGTYKKGIKNLPWAIFALFFPDTGVCNICGDEGEIVCKKCSTKMMRHEGTLCQKCGRTIQEKKTLCRMCGKDKRPYDKGIITFFYDGIAKDAMKEYKFENILPYSQYFAQEVSKSINPIVHEIDIITAVPMHYVKLVGKGYNPPAIIAKRLAKIIDIKYEQNIIRRRRYTKSMSLLKGINRMKHSKQNFVLGNKSIINKNILIIDDVSTTGATLHVCADILKRAGANKVFVLAICGDSCVKSSGENRLDIV